MTEEQRELLAVILADHVKNITDAPHSFAEEQMIVDDTCEKIEELLSESEPDKE